MCSAAYIGVKAFLKLNLHFDYKKCTVWNVNDMLVDPYPFYCIKIVWIDQNKKGYGSTKTSLTVHPVFQYKRHELGCSAQLWGWL